VPTLPLLATPADPTDIDAPRHVAAPGGYEWWHFEAFDPVADLRVSATLFDGNPFHPGYLYRYAAYRRFPTRVRPPVPSEYPAVSLAIYRHGRCKAHQDWRHPPGSCTATPASVRIGRDGFARLEDGGVRLTIGQLADLTFHPTTLAAPRLRTFAPAVSVRDGHGWVVSNPACAVEGDLKVGRRHVKFDGVGYQDHQWGAEPIALAARRWFWACTWLQGRAVVVTEVVPMTGASAGPRIIDAEESGSAAWDARTAWRMPIPSSVDFGNALRLDTPYVVESSPVSAQLYYRARVGGGAATTALAHVVEPGRAGWPVVGPMLKPYVIREA